MSNIKYVIEKHNLTNKEKIIEYTIDKDPILVPSVKFYFASIENFINRLEK